MALIGQLVGHYRLTQLIGQGGMGEIYLAQDTRLPRQVAIKVIRNEHEPYPDSEAVQQAERLFYREMKAISQLDHPHILSLYDFDEEKGANGSLLYMVMPYRPEGSLRDWLRQRGPQLLSPPDVGRLVMQAASALQHAHDHDIIHQDVKPSNFLVRRNEDHPGYPDLLLMDFGVATILSGTVMTSHMARGTSPFMAPEQWRGNPLPATDQYALAVMAYQLLTGRYPFQGGSPEQIMFQHLTMPPIPPSRQNAVLSAAIDAVLLRAMEKQAEARFATIKAFAFALQEALTYTDIKATLAIRKTEAPYGTTRTITLPDMSQATVVIPAGIQDGEVIRLPGLGRPYYHGGPQGPILLTISTALTEEIAPVTNEMAEKTVRSEHAKPSSVVGESQKSMPGLHQVTTLPQTGGMYVPGSPASLASSGKKFLKKRVVLPVACVVVILIMVVLRMANINVITPTNNVQTTEQIRAGATATAQYNANATATAQSNMEVTATAQVIAANPDPYPPKKGKLVYYDPLSQADLNWSPDTDSSFGGTCQFTGGAYHVSQVKPTRFYHCDDASFDDFSNFAFEVKMTIIKGDCGGFLFRFNTTNGADYLFKICHSGTYGFYSYPDYTGKNTRTLGRGSSAAIHAAYNQANVVAVVANGSTLAIYVNNQIIDSATDAAYSHGGIALLADDYSNPTEVSFSNAKVWTF